VETDRQVKLRIDNLSLSFGGVTALIEVSMDVRDNEAYMNTGIQVSSATPRYTWTGTSPTGNTRGKKQIMEIMAAHRMPYAATASIAFPDDLTAKIKKAREMRGTRFIHMLSPCTTGWKIGDDMAVKVSQASVESNVFPLYEIEGGLTFTITHQSRNLPVEKYLMLQGRYRHLKKEEIHDIQAETDRAWADLQGRVVKGMALRYADQSGWER